MRFNYFGPNLKYFRQLRQFTQDQLARRATRHRCSFSQTYISRLERGMKPARDEHVNALAVALEVPVSVLLSRPRIVRAAEGRPVIIVTEVCRTDAQEARS